MTEAQQEAVPTHGPRRRFWRLLSVAVVVCVLALTTSRAVTRPRWHTFVSSPTKTSPSFALVIRIPVGWECQNVPGPLLWSNIDGDAIEVTLRRIPESDRLAVGTAEQTAEAYRISLQTGVSGSVAEHSVTDLQRLLRHFNAYGGNLTTFRTFRHALGWAFDEMCAPVLGPPVEPVDKDITALSDPSGYPERHRATHIFVGKHPTNEWIYVEASEIGPNADFSPTQSTWNEIVRSIRVLQK